MSTELPPSSNSDSPQDQLRNALKQIKQFVFETVNVREGTDVKGTMEGIERDMVFKGHSVWILIFSIFIASIGLNQNSTPVIIGAMLISPLMGPILGIGLAVATVDWSKLKKALKNLGIAVFVAILTSTLYFAITPISDAQSELLARTNPTFLDVLVALFGGASGILAGSRREKSNVIPGVAIATALMPPLCTSGYGIATGQWEFFIGSFYLFFINSVFITLSTILAIRYFHFPKKVHNPKRERLVNRYIFIFVVIVALPSGKIFFDLIQETQYRNMAKQYIENNFKTNGYEVINSMVHYNDTCSTIDVYLIGELLPNYKIEEIKSKLKDYELLPNKSFMSRNFPLTKKTVLKVHQAKDASDKLRSEFAGQIGEMSQKVRLGVLEDIYKKNEEIIKSKDEKIYVLEKKLLEISKAPDTIPLFQLTKEVKIQYPNIEQIIYADATDYLSAKKDTVSTVILKWKKRTHWRKIRKEKKELKRWLQVRLQKDSLRLIEYR